MKPSRDRLAALAKVAELALCSDQDLEWLVGYTDEVCLPAGETVAREGRLCTAFVVVMKGALLARSHGASHRLGPGDCIGWDEMWERSSNPATVSVDADARLLVMSHAQFRAVKALVDQGSRRSCVSQVAEIQIEA